MSTLPSASQIVDIYSSETKVWLGDEDEAWISATCVSAVILNNVIRLTLRRDKAKRGEPTEFIVEHSLSKIEKYGESILPPLKNPPNIENTDDLTSLSYLNEPSVLNTIRTRYEKHFIYTYSGIVLIAVNPFDRVNLYGPQIVQQYSGKRRDDLDPHLFAIAEDAYRCMIRESSNQTIVVSGESGAGKTVSAKYIMRYFAMANDVDASGRARTRSAMTEVEKRILATNPIMEAFGNAKTTRNDNSSRFGKYIEIQFDRDISIIGARFKTYLLERSRLIFQPDTERNYHIFYQMCAGMPLKEKAALGIGSYTNFQYLNQSGAGELAGVNDAEEFSTTQTALTTVGLSEELQANIFRVLAALLHIGNIHIDGRNDALLAEGDPALVQATRLLGIDETDFRKWIVQKQIRTSTEKITTNLSPQQAHVVKDSVAKFVYANLFDWLVGIINDRLACFDETRVVNFIGVLDIYGFEHFERNSFEQFCINYANEKLQQQFNQHVFKLEQEEYEREKIDWTFIKFTDNQECIELIEGQLGILSILDEDSRKPGSTDKGFLDNLYANFDKSELKQHFKKPRFPKNSFIIAHYAHEVEYEVDNFLDKNKDAVPDEHLSLLKRTEFDFLREVLEKTGQLKALSSARSKRQSMIARKPTLGYIFKNSLINLMETIGDTNVHYIRCIKPNETKSAWQFEPQKVLSQLRACGVLETIRISCAGYPSRWTFQEFADRYYVLVNSRFWKVQTEKETRSLCAKILSDVIGDQDKYQVGLSKIFFRAGQLAYFEKLRSTKLNESATLLQKHARRYINRLRYLRIRELVLRLQCVSRRKIAVQACTQLRRHRAALRIQTCWRRHVCREAYHRKYQFIVGLETAIRGHLARRHFKTLRETNAAVKIQKTFRGWRTRQSYIALRRCVVYLQSYIRRRAAKKHYYELKAEARSVKHLQGKVGVLEQTLQNLKDKNKDSEEISIEKIRSLESYLAAQIEKNNAMETQLQESAMLIKNQESTIAKLNEDISIFKDQAAMLAKLKEEHAKELKTLEAAIVAQKQDRERKHAVMPMAATGHAEKAVIARLECKIRELQKQLSQGRVENERDRPQPRTHMKTQDARALGMRRNSLPNVPSVQTKFPDGASHSEDTLYHPRPTSATPFDTRHRTMMDTEVEKEIQAILRHQDALLGEILNGLIYVKIPKSDKHSLEPKQILFPAHMVSLYLTQLWRCGNVQESHRVLRAVIDAIEKCCRGFVGVEALAPCSFWLANVHELYSLTYLEEHILRWNEYDIVAPVLDTISECKTELNNLEKSIYGMWIKELKTALQPIIVPAVIDGQSLPGFRTEDTRWSIRKLLTGSTPVSVDDLLDLLTNIWETAATFHVHQRVKTDMIMELLKMIGVSAFNELLEKPNFTTWKRAMQIEYNINQLNAWCKLHDIHEGSAQLVHLVESVRILQRRKNHWDDIEKVFESCTVLSPAQIQRLLSRYPAADYEESVDTLSLNTITARTIAKDKSGRGNVLLLDAVPLDYTTKPFVSPPVEDTRPVTYLPSWLPLKHLRRLADLMQLQRDQPMSFDDDLSTTSIL